MKPQNIKPRFTLYRSDNIVEVGTVEQLIAKWHDEQITPLVPLESRANRVRGVFRHGYECECESCRECLPPVELSVWPLAVGLTVGCLLWSGLLVGLAYLLS